MADAFDELVFAGAPLDRAAELRLRHDILRRLLAEPTTAVLDVGRHSVAAVRDGERVSLRLRSPQPDDEGREALLLGRHDGRVVLGVRVEGEGLTPLREVADLLPSQEASFAATAVALDNWHGTHPRCSRCGEPTVIDQAGWVRTCQADDSQHHPRTDPAVIMAVTDESDRLLLARGAGWPEGRMSVLAGFVEPGETLAAAVAREVREEVGVEVVDVRYQGDQPWPFPASLMVGFTARATTTELTLDGSEIADARWFTREELRAALESRELRRPSSVSISARLIERWYGGPLAASSNAQAVPRAVTGT
jgi:NAD+ diphosphatase